MSEVDMLASAEHVWNERQLQEVMPGTTMSRMVQGSSFAAAPEEVARMQEASASIDFEAVARRITQATGGNTEGYELTVQFLVVQIIDVPFPPSPPPPPPRPFDAPALPPLPPSPPPKPPRPPPSPPFGAILKALSEQLNATTEVGFKPPSPRPPTPKPPSPKPPSPPAEVGVPKPPPSPPAKPSPPSPPVVSRPPSPPRKPPPSPPKPTPFKFAKFKGLYGMGVYLDKSVVWYDTPNFRQLRTARSSLNLIFWTPKYECPPRQLGVCKFCPRAWIAGNTTSTANVTILFREPWQLDAIHIEQLMNPGVIKVELLPWPAVVIPGLVDKNGKQVPAVPGTLAPPVRNVAVDSSLCASTLDIKLTPQRAGTDLPVPDKGSQAALPDSLKASAYGGINIIVKEQIKKTKTLIDMVTFDGRALYVKDTALYTGNDVRVYG